MELLPHISVAVCDTPGGKYEYLGKVRYGDGRTMQDNMPFDPAVINDEGRIFLYYGFVPPFPVHGKFQACDGCSVIELYDDMLTAKAPPTYVLPREEMTAGTGFEGYGYFEAPSIRRFGDTYYLVYCPVSAHELCYATSSSPVGDFTFGGALISNGNLGFEGQENATWPTANNHGGLVQVNEDYYIFYHRHTHGTMFSRQGCAERVIMLPDGTFAQAEMTSQGMNGAPLPAVGRYPASMACVLHRGEAAEPLVFGKISDAPAVDSKNGAQFVARVTDGTVIGYKYFTFEGKTRLSVSYRGKSQGTLYISDEVNGEPMDAVFISPTEQWTKAVFCFEKVGESALYLRYSGENSAELLALEFE